MPDPHEAPSPPQRCPGCGVVLEPHHRFCYNCGAQIRETPVAATSAADEETLTLDVSAQAIARPGELFADRFLVQHELGAGGMGVVYLVEDKDSGLRLALKVLKPEFTRDVGVKSRFQREIRILARIRHPSIPRIVEWGTAQDAMFFVAELVHGKNLGQVIEERGQLKHTEAVPLVISVVKALESAHQAGVVHRDIKPTNIMISEAGAIFLIDFGVARSLSAEMTQLTETGLFIGTPQYMSPEQLDSRHADERSDIYSLGVVLYQLVTGKLPFSGDTPMAIAAQHITRLPPAPRTLTPSIPFWLERIILRCLEKDPANRFWTASELLTELKKSHRRARIRRRSMVNGDVVVEDPARRNGWALTITTKREKDGWGSGITLYYRDSFYQVKSTRPLHSPDASWEYGLDPWPDGEVMRRVVDYESEVAMQGSEGSILSRARKWIDGRMGG